MNDSYERSLVVLDAVILFVFAGLSGWLFLTEQTGRWGFGLMSVWFGVLGAIWLYMVRK